MHSSDRDPAIRVAAVGAPGYNCRMDDRAPDDRMALLELLLFVPCSFLLAWFLAGFSLLQLWEIAAPIVLAGGYWVSIAAAVCFVWLTGWLQVLPGSLY
jgi:hypothetical protein